MRILVTGKGTSGSWAVRGAQLGAAMGATVKAQATLSDMRAHDVVFVVKRYSPDMAKDLRACGRPVVLDIVDCWPQPLGNEWDRDRCIAHASERIDGSGASRVIYATERMQEDIGFPGLALHHHGRPGQALNPIRQHVRVVGYEGNTNFLGHKRGMVEAECERRGWRLDVGGIAVSDIAIATRDGIWQGYATRHWKSNIKLANCHITGTPCVMNRESGYEETSSGAEYWFHDLASLRFAFDWLTDQDARRSVQEKFVQHAITVEQSAEKLRAYLGKL